MRFALLALVFAIAALPASAELSQMVPAAVGVNGAALSGAPETNAIPMTSGAVTFTQLTLDLVVTAGTSTTMTVTCKGSADGTTFHAIERCADGATQTCTARTWSYDLSTQTSFILNVPSNYVAIKCKFSATGTGTIVARAIRGSP